MDPGPLAGRGSRIRHTGHKVCPRCDNGMVALSDYPHLMWVTEGHGWRVVRAAWNGNGEDHSEGSQRHPRLVQEDILGTHTSNATGKEWQHSRG